MNIEDVYVLVAVKPLYGIREAGLHWFITYPNHHIEHLDMTQSSTDKFILFIEDKNQETNMVILQVDDSFGTGSQKCLHEEETASKRFASKPRKLFDVGTKMKFNGSTIERLSTDSYKLSQEDKLASIEIPSTMAEAKKLKYQLQYVATSCRPDLSSC